MTPLQLYNGLRALEAIYGIQHAGSTVPWRSIRLGETEAILHEVVHGMCLGDPRWSGAVDQHLPLDGPGRAAQELKTLRVECRVLALAGISISRRKALKLFLAADFEGRDVTRAQFEAPLTRAEEKLAKLTLRLITDALGLLEFEVP